MKPFFFLLMAVLAASNGAFSAERTVFRRPFGRVASMDPIRAADVLAAEAVTLVYEPLLEVDYKARPYRLKECVCKLPEVSADGLTYTFRLNDGITFRNGTPIRAATAFSSSCVEARGDSFISISV